MSSWAARALSRGRLRPSLFLACVSILAALAVAAGLILVAGHDPVRAYAALADGALGSWYGLTVGLNKAVPYLLTAVGIALCFRARVINLGGEGQIALGGLAASWIALEAAAWPGVLLLPAACLGAAIAGAAWAVLAICIHLARRVHEVLATLLLNFVALLIVAEALHRAIGEPGAGFPQSPMLPRQTWMPKLWPESELHLGLVLAIAAAVAAHVLLWRTTFGFGLRVIGASRSAATYAGFSHARAVVSVMAIAGATAGLAGAVEVLGAHYRLIEGFSTGFGFKALAIALLAGTNPLAAIPASIFFGLLEAGTLSMQRETGLPSGLVFVIEGLAILFILASASSGAVHRRVGG